mmetsp:Transcript_67425/g.190050  ORF Transcript_67425/g.190050 Transcript_67425/m.190050 type:complete len:462 (-) Transcript_67425:84-1469(-)
MPAAIPHALANLGGTRRPLDWAQTAVSLGQQVMQVSEGALRESGLLQPVTKGDLRPGDHVYAWRLGWTYSHHGVVVRTEACAPDCPHDTMSCCGIVHFRPPSGDAPGGRIELVDLAGFVGGRGVCRCKYGVPPAEFYLSRSGSCATERPDPWPLAVLRALSLLEPGVGDAAGMGSAGADAEAARAVEYDLLRKNSELLARWCLLGGASGVRRFLSSETAFSLQTAPGRFVRLGLAAAVAGTAVAGAAAAISASGAAASSAAATAGAATGAVGTAASSSATGAAATATTAASAVGGEAAALAGEIASAAAAQPVAAAAASPWLAAGTLAASSAARNFLLDVTQRPHEAAQLLSQISRALPSSQDQPPWQSLIGVEWSNREPRGADAERRYQQEQKDALVTALGACFNDLHIHVAKPLSQLVACPVGCTLLCEMLVDLLESEMPEGAADCAAHVQSFLEGLHG